MKRKLFTLLLCMVFICTLSLPVYADSTTTSSDGYSALISDIPKTCPTCGSSLHASWFSTSGAEVELTINDNGTIKIPAGAGVVASIRLYCTNCKYEKNETRLLGLDWGSERPGEWKVEQAPSGIGRKDLPGYADDNGTPTIGVDGLPTLTFKMSLNGFSTKFGGEFLYGSPIGSYSNGTYSITSTYNFTGFYSSDNATNYPTGCVSFYFVAPYTGYYQITDASCSVKIVSKDKNGNIFSDNNDASSARVGGSFESREPSVPSRFYDSMRNGVSRKWTPSKVYIVKGKHYFFNFYLQSYYSLDSLSGHPVYYDVSINFPAPTVTVTDIGSIATINKQTNITINNNTWNGNIYTDNSTNLTYIYPQYTTINEKNETVTNISNTPIIYNNETKQYYTYDQTTKNYYYITYNAQPTPSPSPNPAPSESPTPTPTPDPGTTPTPTPKPGGSISTPETGKPGSSSGSGQSWWDKLLDKLGNAVIDGLLGAVSAVLKLIFKLLSTILGWIIWAVSLVFTLFPFLPPGVSGLLVGGVVVCFVIGIIKFIRG